MIPPHLIPKAIQADSPARINVLGSKHKGQGGELIKPVNGVPHWCNCPLPCSLLLWEQQISRRDIGRLNL
jgi:hypothetical protein